MLGVDLESFDDFAVELDKLSSLWRQHPPQGQLSRGSLWRSLRLRSHLMIKLKMQCSQWRMAGCRLLLLPPS